MVGLIVKINHIWITMVLNQQKFIVMNLSIFHNFEKELRLQLPIDFLSFDMLEYL